MHLTYSHNQWNLICQREYLVALIECTYFIGLVMGNIIWGGLADKIGRWRAYIIGHIVAIVFGVASVFAPSVEVFIIFRFFTAIGSISYNIIYTIRKSIYFVFHYHCDELWQISIT